VISVRTHSHSHKRTNFDPRWAIVSAKTTAPTSVTTNMERSSINHRHSTPKPASPLPPRRRARSLHGEYNHTARTTDPRQTHVKLNAQGRSHRGLRASRRHHSRGNSPQTLPILVHLPAARTVVDVVAVASRSETS
jgi:hypothetical protein